MMADLPPDEAAAKRVSYRLTFARTDQPREFSAGWLDGPAIPNAYGDGTSSGAWTNPDDGFADLDVRGWFDRFASYALGEAVHEALEWFRVDGQPWLNPHGKAEELIHAVVGRMCADLAELAAEHRASSGEVPR